MMQTPARKLTGNLHFDSEKLPAALKKQENGKLFTDSYS